MDELRKQLEAKRNEFKRFDALPADEKRRLTEQGMNPHEPAEIRKAKKKKIQIIAQCLGMITIKINKRL